MPFGASTPYQKIIKRNTNRSVDVIKRNANRSVDVYRTITCYSLYIMVGVVWILDFLSVLYQCGMKEF